VTVRVKPGSFYDSVTRGGVTLSKHQGWVTAPRTVADAWLTATDQAGNRLVELKEERHG
jgi:hypothetical protein